MARAFLIVWLVLGFLTGGFEVRLRLVRPACCEAPDSACCSPDHDGDCCKKTLEVTVTGKRDQTASAAETAPSTPALDLALAALASEAAPPLRLEPIARATRLDSHPPPDPTRTTVLRL